MTKNEAKQILIDVGNAKMGNTPLLPYEVREAIEVITQPENTAETIDEAIREYLVGVIFDKRIAETEVGAIKEHIAKAIKFGAHWQSMR